MNLRSIAVFALLSAAACGKTSDVPRLQEEAVGLVSTYTPRVDALQRRVKELDQRGQALAGTPNSAPAQQLWSQARAKVDQLRGLLQSLPGAAQTAAKTNNAEELDKLIDESRERIEKDTTEASDELDAVESWMWVNESARASEQGKLPAEPLPAGAGTSTGTGAQPVAPTETTGAATDGTSPPPTAAPTPPGAGSDAGRRLP